MFKQGDKSSVWLGIIIVSAILIGWVPLILFDFGQWAWLGQLVFEYPVKSTEVLRNISFPIGGVAAVLIAIWRARAADIQNEVANKAHEREILKIDEERYVAGISGIGAEAMQTRLAAIYALVRLASNTTPAITFSTVELLTSFARERSEQKRQELKLAGNPTDEIIRAPEDIVRAVKALLELQPLRPDDIMELDNLYLVSAPLGDVVFNNCSLAGTNLSNANLRQARFENTAIRQTQFNGAFLEHSIWKACDITQSEFSDSKMTSTEFSDCAIRYVEMDKANLSGVIFTESKCIDVNVSKSQLDDVQVVGGNQSPFIAWADWRPDCNNELQEFITLFKPYDTDEGRIFLFDEEVEWVAAIQAYPEESDDLPF